MDESYRKERSAEIEEAPKIGEEEPTVATSRQDEEVYSLDEAYKRKRDTEIAQEMTATEFDRPIEATDQETEMKSEVKTGFGWLALILSVLSFFVAPILLGAAGIIFGFISKNRGADTLGNTAITAGAISIIITLFIAPFV
ncbi:hypothetical protein [Aquibacillus salsiterrae]|uniref:DUF4190 domain-containing protein n=1 Tax=Aquibacillus salsiterrae TaxID=2950439 RepID=A0A9X4AF01_9BACI|nr:hypothetical protein [Aquibacillus salsiterrae]MDC3415538.1 hypothetical protein [Aquibacillus salsiterrae]